MEFIKDESESNLVSEVELVYRCKVPNSLRQVIRVSGDSFRLFKANWNTDKIDYTEQFKVMYLNSRNGVLAINEISSGGLTATVADPRMIFAAALKLNATALIMAHNHPSGNLMPSHMDRMLTDKIKSAGRLLDIQVLDHIILSSEGFYSFADEGLL